MKASYKVDPRQSGGIGATLLELFAAPPQDIDSIPSVKNKTILKCRQNCNALSPLRGMLVSCYRASPAKAGSPRASKKNLYILLVVGILMAIFWGLMIFNYCRQKIFVVVVPHHNLVKDMRTEILQAVAKKEKVETVILVSTNHFNAGKGDIITTHKDWSLVNGTLEGEKEKIAQLTGEGIASDEESAFENEHGIKNLLGEVKSVFKVKIIPIIIKPDTDKESLERLGSKLKEVCTKKCLVIASVDFSHYQYGGLAEIHDDLSIRALEDLDKGKIWQAETDSDETLFLAMEWAKLHKAENFVLRENTNSGKLTEARDAETTSYVTGWYEKGKRQESRVNNFSFMIAPKIAVKTKPGEIFKLFGDRVLWGTDYVWLNLDIKSGDWARWLKWLKLDRGNYFPTRDMAAKFEEQKIGFYIGVDAKKIIADMKKDGVKIRKVVVYTKQTKKEFIAQAARSFINKGAELVICDSSNKIEMEKYRDKIIVHSLGSLVEGDKCNNALDGLMVAGLVKGEELELVFMPTKTENCQPMLVSGEARTKIITQLRQELGIKNVDTGYGFDMIRISVE